MSCETIRPLLHAHVDGELDLVRDLEVERHLASCPACARACQELQALQSALRSLLPPADPPPRLRTRIQSALRAAGAPPASPRPWWPRAAFPLLGISLVVAAWLLFHDGPLSSWFDRTPQEVIASHERFRMSEHLDVESSDPARVRTWFQGKLPFAPPVPDLGGQGFTLAGGRLDIVGQRPVAGLVYHHAGHEVSLLMWPAPAGCGGQPPQATESGEHHLVHWSQSGLDFWAVSDLDEPELLFFVEQVRPTLPVGCH
jgi:anti-sigma factor RsiW